jgi:hypothetical protein
LDLASQAGITIFISVTTLVKTPTFENGKALAEHQHKDCGLKGTNYFADPFAS